jgi:Protein of unknown function (DUF3302)
MGFRPGAQDDRRVRSQREETSVDRHGHAGPVRAAELNLLLREDAVMSGYDIFAWIVLIILVACVVAVFCIAGWLPGHIAKSRGHPWAEAVTVAGWVTLICGLALWPIALIWAYVDVPARPSQERPQ